jgi:hypothetical protein
VKRLIDAAEAYRKAHERWVAVCDRTDAWKHPAVRRSWERDLFAAEQERDRTRDSLLAIARGER